MQLRQLQLWRTAAAACVSCSLKSRSGASECRPIACSCGLALRCRGVCYVDVYAICRDVLWAECSTRFATDAASQPARPAQRARCSISFTTTDAASQQEQPARLVPSEKHPQLSTCTTTSTAATNPGRKHHEGHREVRHVFDTTKMCQWASRGGMRLSPAFLGPRGRSPPGLASMVSDGAFVARGALLMSRRHAALADVQA